MIYRGHRVGHRVKRVPGTYFPTTKVLRRDMEVLNVGDSEKIGTAYLYRDMPLGALL